MTCPIVAPDMYQGLFERLRAAANEDSSPIDLTSQGDFAQKPATAVEIRSDSSGFHSRSNDIFIALAGGAAADKTLTWRLFAWAKVNGMAQQVAYGTGTLGTQAVVTYPNDESVASIFWCDTLVVTEHYWPKVVKATGNGGNNSVAMLSLDLLGWPWWFMQIEDADGATGNEAANVSAWWKWR